MITKSIIKQIVFLSVILSLSLIPDIANAEGAVATLQTLFKNGITSWQGIIHLMGALMYVSGVIIGGMAIVKFKDLSDGKIPAHMPILLSIISAALIASPSIIMTITSTYYGDKKFQPDNLLTSIPQTSVDGVSDALTSVLIFVQMLGVIAFFRGFLMLKSVGTGKDGQLGKAMTHILGGVLAINIQATVGMLARTFFAGMQLPMGIGNW
jgi:hypothetical protein